MLGETCFVVHLSSNYLTSDDALGDSSPIIPPSYNTLLASSLTPDSQNLLVTDMGANFDIGRRYCLCPFTNTHVVTFRTAHLPELSGLYFVSIPALEEYCFHIIVGWSYFLPGGGIYN